MMSFYLYLCLPPIVCMFVYLSVTVYLSTCLFLSVLFLFFLLFYQSIDPTVSPVLSVLFLLFITFSVFVLEKKRDPNTSKSNIFIFNFFLSFLQHLHPSHPPPFLYPSFSSPPKSHTNTKLKCLVPVNVTAPFSLPPSSPPSGQPTGVASWISNRVFSAVCLFLSSCNQRTSGRLVSAPSVPLRLLSPMRRQDALCVNVVQISRS